MEGSYTVEAALVMAVLLLAVWTMVRAAYGLHDRVTGEMILHEMVELSAHEPQLDLQQVEAMGNGALKHLFLSKNGVMVLEKKGEGLLGTLSEKNWSRQIQVDRVRPQDFLRKMTLLEELGEKNGDSL